MAFTHSDPLEGSVRPERVNYENGVLLDETDFRDEQTYFRGRLGRALAFLHGSGTVAGLRVRAHPNEPHVIVVEPGLALDPVGRLIELPVPYCIRALQWFAAQEQQPLSESYANSGIERVIVDLFIRFDVCGRGMTPFMGRGNMEVTDAFTFNRLLDSAALSLEIRTEPAASQPRPDPYGGLPSIDADDPPDMQEALDTIRNHKLDRAWDTEQVDGGGDHRVLLNRIAMPCTADPMSYDTGGSIVFDDSIRLLSFTTTELFWLINAMRGDES